MQLLLALILIWPLALQAAEWTSRPLQELAVFAEFRAQAAVVAADEARLAAEVLESPIAVVNLIASGRQWFKAEIGIGARELPLDVSICAHAILQHDTMVVTDTREDPRFVNNPLVTVDDGLRFYAGALLKTPEGLPLGTLCVFDPRPQRLDAQQTEALAALSRLLIALPRAMTPKYRNSRISIEVRRASHTQ